MEQDCKVQNQIEEYKMQATSVNFQKRSSLNSFSGDNVFCRICLSHEIENNNNITFEERVENNEMVQPCKCSGSIQNVHEQCIKRWILKKTNTKSENVYRCQICSEIIKFQLGKQSTCSTKNPICEKITKGDIVFFMILLVIIGGLTYINFIKSQKIQPIYAQILLMLLFIVACLVELLHIFFVIGQVIYEEKVVVKKVHNFESNENNKLFLCLKKKRKPTNQILPLGIKKKLIVPYENTISKVQTLSVLRK